ncbi:MAG: endo alpha-1,4 polygalactosaminidase [Actinomycetota bacterium]
MSSRLSAPPWELALRRLVWLPVALAAVLLAGCSDDPSTEVAAPTATAAPPAAPATPTEVPTATPTPGPTPTPAPTPTPTPIPEPWVPAPGTTFQWQLIDSIDTGFDVDMYDIDLFDAPQGVIDGLRARGIEVICYFSAGSFEEWRIDADTFPAEVLGASNGWPGEVWLDIRRIDLIAPTMTARLDLAASKRCTGVEPDNVDAYINDSGFDITPEDQIAYLRFLAGEAHARGLSIGLKNAVELVPDLVDDFDWTLNERCMVFDECARLTPFIEAGKAVFHVEYEGDLAWCPLARELGFVSLEKDLLVTSVYRPCPAPDGG